jgi:hypothetical protein
MCRLQGSPKGILQHRPALLFDIADLPQEEVNIGSAPRTPVGQ